MSRVLRLEHPGLRVITADAPLGAAGCYRELRSVLPKTLTLAPTLALTLTLTPTLTPTLTLTLTPTLALALTLTSCRVEHRATFSPQRPWRLHRSRR